VFYWGNLAGDTQIGTGATFFQTTATDAAQVFAHLTGSAAISDPHDFDRSGDVTGSDALIVFATIGTLPRIDLVSPSLAPGTPELLAASDTGISNSDQVTNLNNSSPAAVLQFEVSGTVAGATVTIEADGVTIGSAIASGPTTTVVTDGASVLADGNRSITARQIASDQSTSGASAALVVAIDTTAAVSSIVAVSPDPRTTGVDEMTIFFNEPVFGLAMGALDLTRNLGADLLGGAQTIDTLDGGLTWTLHNLTGITTLAGYYELTLAPGLSGTIDTAGNVPSGASSGFTVWASLMGRLLFYNQSAFDGNDVAVNALDDAAVAIDKSAYLPGDGLAIFENVSSYSRGINGVMVDLANSGGAITSGDFTFKVGNNNSPDSWGAGPAPSAVVVRAGEGVGGSDRVVITWANMAIINAWLQVIVEGNDALGGFNSNTGLGASDVFFFGSRLGDSGTSTPATVFETTSTDAIQVFASITGSAAIDNPRDYNRSGEVTSTDAAIVLAGLGTLVRIDIGAGGPFAPSASATPSDDGRTGTVGAGLDGVASALAVAPDGSGGASAAPPLASDRTERVDHDHPAPVASVQRALEPSGPRNRPMLAALEPIIDAVVLDDEWLEALLVELDSVEPRREAGAPI
jgi:hypothetical protein